MAVEAFRDRERAMKLIKDKDLNFVFLEDEELGGEKVYQKYGVSAFPSTFIFGKNGKLSSFHLGFGKGMEEEIKKDILIKLDE